MKLSRLTVPYRSFSSLAVLLGVIVFTSPGAIASADLKVLLVFLSVALASGSLILLYHYIYWRKYSIKVTGEEIEIRKGVFSRNYREIPLRRIQNIDLDMNIFLRILGIVVVRLETAGGSEVEASIRYLDLDDAERLQQEIRDLKDRRAESVEEREDHGYELSLRNLLILSSTSLNRKAVGAFFLVLSLGAGFVGSFLASYLPASLIVLTVAILASLSVWAGSFTANFARFFDFRLDLKDNSLDYSRGLLNRASGSIPREKIQSLIIEENVLKRVLGYGSLRVETAGYSSGQEEKQSETVIPLSGGEEVRRFGRKLESFDDPDFSRIDEKAKKRYTRRYILISMVLAVLSVTANRFYSIPLLYALPILLLISSRWAAELKWESIGYALGEDHLAVRKGFWLRETYIVPYFRLQNLMKSQTVFQRRWGQSTLTVDTAGSVRTNPEIIDMDARLAEELRNELFERFKHSLKKTS